MYSFSNFNYFSPPNTEQENKLKLKAHDAYHESSPDLNHIPLYQLNWAEHPLLDSLQPGLRNNQRFLPCVLH